MIKLVVGGAAGRMGQRIIANACTADFKLVGAVERPKSSHLGKDAGLIAGCGECGVPIVDAVEKVIAKADVLIDFSDPSITLLHLETAAKAQKTAVIGTTGHSPEQRQSIERLSTKLPFVLSPNMSTGVNLAFSLLGEAARVLGKGFEVRMTEVHHIHKKDRPSGTALKMAEAIAGPLGIDPATISIQSIRKGEVVGDHTVLFGSASETLEITHRALSRDTFALGALRAAQWIVGKPNGIYSMADVLGLKS